MFGTVPIGICIGGNMGLAIVTAVVGELEKEDTEKNLSELFEECENTIIPTTGGWGRG